MSTCSYIHIPFCKSKCNYCTFVSCTNLSLMQKYIVALKNEIMAEYRGEELSTLYFGGGTPSLLDIADIKSIINLFNFSSNNEITLELNPDDVTYDYVSALRDIGVNRLSIGSQTFCDSILKYIGRRHNSRQVIKSVDVAKKSGFVNISLDLIYGLPFQTLKMLQDDIDKIVETDVPHISTYGLKIEEGSYFAKHAPENLPNNDEQADMYETINSRLKNFGYDRYEVSNFSKHGFESRHNLNYWNNGEYYGFGVSAHGYIDGVRYSNSDNIENYIFNPNNNKQKIRLSRQEQLEEEIFLGFRKSSGINIKKIQEKYDVDFESKYKDILLKYPDYFEKTDIGYRLNLKGVMLSNVLLSEFIETV